MTFFRGGVFANWEFPAEEFGPTTAKLEIHDVICSTTVGHKHDIPGSFLGNLNLRKQFELPFFVQLHFVFHDSSHRWYVLSQCTHRLHYLEFAELHFCEIQLRPNYLLLLLFNLIKSDALSDEISDIYGGPNLTSGRPWCIWVSCNFVLSSKLHFRYVHIFISLNFNWVNLVDYEGNSDTIKCHPSALAEWFSSTLRYLEPSALEIMIYMDGVLLCYPDAFQSYKHLI